MLELFFANCILKFTREKKHLINFEKRRRDNYFDNSLLYTVNTISHVIQFLISIRCVYQHMYIRVKRYRWHLEITAAHTLGAFK